jgi:hypothetical protein
MASAYQLDLFGAGFTLLAATEGVGWCAVDGKCERGWRSPAEATDLDGSFAILKMGSPQLTGLRRRALLAPTDLLLGARNLRNETAGH